MKIKAEKAITDVVLYDQYPNASRIVDMRDRITLEQGSVLQPFELRLYGLVSRRGLFHGEESAKIAFANPNLVR